MSILLQDLRFGFRSLLRQPLFTGAAALVLALGIGANIAVFSVINAVLLRPLPYPNPDQLIQIRESQVGRLNLSVAYPNYLDWQAGQRSFTDLALQRTRSFNVSFQAGGGNVPERVGSAEVSANFLTILGIQPQVGRDLQASDDFFGADPVALISDSLWRRRFAADPAAVGRSLTVEGVSRKIVGVMPAFLDLPRETELYVPLANQRQDHDVVQRGSHPGFAALGRLKSGVTLAQATQDLNAIAAELERRHPDSNTGYRIDARTLLEARVGSYRSNLYLLLIAVVCVLLIACANVANLQLARATGRTKELAVRAALGASRWRLVRQLLTEGVLLSVFGGALAILLALWAIDAIVQLTPPTMARFHEVRLDYSVLGFSALVALGAGLLIGVWPAWRMSRADVMTRSLHEGSSRGSTGGASQQRVRSTLVVAQVALAVVLLAGAGLTLKSFYRSQTEPLGFEPARTLVLSVTLPDAKYDKAKKDQFIAALLDKVRALPGVASAAMALNIPFDNSAWTESIHVTGTPPDQPGQEPASELSYATAGYFQTMSIPFLRGRDFGPQDILGENGRAVIIDDAFAYRFFPGQDPVGKRIDDGDASANDKTPPLTVVGVVGHTRNEAPAETEYAPNAFQMYLCPTQGPIAPTDLLIHVAHGDPQRFVDSVRRVVTGLASDVPIARVSTMDENIARSLAPRRLTMVLLAAFAGVALVLASIGLYGVMALSVTQRTRELGIRLALGAQRSAVLGLILRQGVTLVMIGLAVGLAAALISGRMLASMLFGIGGSDPTTLAIVSLVLGGAALLACLLPAQRATRVDPMVALRDE